MFVELFMIIEALKIVKKGSEVFDDGVKIVGKFQNKDVIRTAHSSENRGSSARDEGIDNKEYIEILKKACNFKLKEDNIYDIIYKNANGNYDMLVIAVSEKTITIITILQQNRLSANYHIKPGDLKILSEKFNITHVDITEQY